MVPSVSIYFFLLLFGLKKLKNNTSTLSFFWSFFMVTRIQCIKVSFSSVSDAKSGCEVVSLLLVVIEFQVDFDMPSSWASACRARNYKQLGWTGEEVPVSTDIWFKCVRMQFARWNGEGWEYWKVINDIISKICHVWLSGLNTDVFLSQISVIII